MEEQCSCGIKVCGESEPIFTSPAHLTDHVYSPKKEKHMYTFFIVYMHSWCWRSVSFSHLQERWHTATKDRIIFLTV